MAWTSGIWQLLIVTLVFLPGCGETEDSDVMAMGIKTSRMRYHASRQKESMWCWAACVQMALSTQDIDISQEIVVAKAFGVVENDPGSSRDVLVNINGPMTDKSGRVRYVRGTSRFGCPSFQEMKRQFDCNMPMIVGYSHPGQNIGHAVVVTAVIYELRGGDPHILKVMVRDPSLWHRDANGKRTLSAEEFKRISQYYLVQVEPPSN